MSNFLVDAYPYVLTFHIVAVMSWMAGLFYLPRLFVYHVERALPGDQLDETLERERIRSKDSDIGRVAFPTFLKSVRDRQANLQRSADELEEQIMEVREELAEAFRELKTYETAEAQEQTREREADARAEQIELDDLAIEGHRRNAI